MHPRLDIRVLGRRRHRLLLRSQALPPSIPAGRSQVPTGLRRLLLRSHRITARQDLTRGTTLRPRPRLINTADHQLPLVRLAHMAITDLKDLQALLQHTATTVPPRPTPHSHISNLEDTANHIMHLQLAMTDLLMAMIDLPLAMTDHLPAMTDPLPAMTDLLLAMTGLIPGRATITLHPLCLFLLLPLHLSPPDGPAHPRPASPSREGHGEEEPDWDYDHETIFREPPKLHGADEIRSPLPGPAEYHQDIVLPPVHGAMCVQSKFCNNDNLNEFIRPIRETSRFDAARDDPAFWVNGQPPKRQTDPERSPKQHKQLNGIVRERSPQQPTTPLRKLKTPAEILAGPSPAILKAAEERNSHRKRPRDDTWRQDERGPKRDKETGHRENHQKRPRFDHGDTRDPARPVSRADIDRVLNPRPTSSNDRVLPGFSPRNWDGPHEQSPRDREQRERSLRAGSAAEHEIHQTPSRDSHHRENDRPFSPPPAPAGTPPPESRTSSRRSSFTSQMGQQRHHRSLSRNSFASSGTHDSDLSSVGAELLGRPQKNKEERDDPRQRRDASRMKKRTAPKVDTVYSRRW
ncbi:hypothetical protein ACHAQA_007100 [Verticillium albo-atrum]